MNVIEKDSLIGKKVKKFDAPDKTAGRTRYIHDMNLPNQLYGVIKRTDRVHARIKSIDTSEAEALEGVHAVITAKDVPNYPININKDHTPLKGDKVRSERDEIAAVAAETREIAEKACSLIKVEYEDLPILSDPHEALKDDAPLIHEEKADNLTMDWSYDHGDFDKAVEETDHVVEDEFSLHYVTHCCMGVSGVIAEFESDGTLHLYSNTQVPFLHKREFAQILGMDPTKVHITQPPIGGGFGSKLDIYPFEPICVFLAQKTRRPVKMVFTRHEEFIASPTRQPVLLKLRSGVRKDGTLTFREVDTLHDNGAYTSWGASTPFVMMQTFSSLYRVEACKYRTKVVYTNNPYAGSFRGYGNLQGTFAVEAHMDRLAEEIGMDPLEFRLKNAQKPGEVTGQGMEFKSCGFPDCLESAGARSEFVKKHKEYAAKQNDPDPIKRGIGIASMLHVGGGAKIYPSDGCGTILKFDDFAHVTLLTGASEIGQGSETVLAQLAAEELGIPIDSIKVVNNDTEITPWDVGVHASRTTFIAGNSVIRAARKARDKILDAASQVTNHAADELDIRGGWIVRSADGEALTEVGKMIRGLHFQDKAELVMTTDYYEPPSKHQDKEFKGDVSAAYAWASQVIEVEVDTQTGIVRMKKVWGAHDVGRVLNRLGIEGQIEGGVVMGQGYALTENLIIENGVAQNPGFRDYKLVTAPEIPDLDVEFIESMDGEGPQGAKGVGEAPAICIAAAVGNAIYNATGVRITKAPFTPENVYRHLKEAGAVPA